MQPDYLSLLANIRDGVYFTDTDRRITYWNKAAEHITGYSASEVVGHRCRDNILIHVDDKGRSLCKGRCPLSASMMDLQPRNARVFLHHKEGHRVPVHVRCAPLTDGDGNLAGGAEFFTDISSQEALEIRVKELESLALLDALTQLPNRNHLIPELESRFQEKVRLGLTFGLLFMDIDHFKRFNDTYGHDAGDEVLRTVAKTITSAVRPFDLAGRWGGEEFICIVRNVTPGEQLMGIANRLRRLIATSTVRAKDQILSVTVSMGATMALESDNVESLVKRADLLMYKSKKSGRNQVTLG